MIRAGLIATISPEQDITVVAFASTMRYGSSATELLVYPPGSLTSKWRRQNRRNWRR
jgi:hypothetical protein